MLVVVVVEVEVVEEDDVGPSFYFGRNRTSVSLINHYVAGISRPKVAKTPIL